jgi:hypothetical protein
MADQDNNIEILENQFPPVSGIAFHAAFQQTLKSGLKVLQSEDGVIYEVSPDGSRRQVKEIEPPTQVESGRKITIR